MSESGTETGRTLREGFAAIASRLDDADGLLLGLDFDGTLAEIVERPDEAEIRPGSRRAIRALGEHPRVEVVAVSGRALDDLRSRVDIDSVDYAGNHGLELAVDGDRTVHPLAAKQAERISAVCDDLERRLGDVEGSLVERKGLTATIHHRRASAEATEQIRDAVDEVIEAHGGGIRVSTGKSVVELRPAVPWDKGTAVELLSSSRPAGWATLYVGDDTTDEDVFRRLEDDGYGIHVGDSDTAAAYRVDDPAAVEEFLRWMADDGVGRL